MREEILPLFNEEETQEAVKEEPAKIILKPLPTELKYAYLEKNKQSPVVISSSLTNTQEDCLLKILKRCKKAIDSPWVSPTQVMPMKSEITVVQNDKGEEVSTCLTSAFCSPKQSKNEGELYIFMAKLLEAQIHEETKLWSLIVLCLSRSKYARKEQWRRGKQSKENRDSSCSLPSLLEHFPKSIFYILYTISKIRKSRIQRFKPCTFGAEMRKIWPSEDNCIKLRDNFAPCEIGTPTCEI
ncbi:hypothetical protein CK203_062869 [Vitis vinifera]|uniref:Uncharacterized protein n=1 Tax=Vitis vinifera TaxID=29760 RepID=A0A438FSK8_VITVI|nr:hypothetical protein CK203_062869 [Vitis vinifera]